MGEGVRERANDKGSDTTDVCAQSTRGMKLIVIKRREVERGRTMK